MAIRTVAVGPKTAGGGGTAGPFIARCILPAVVLEAGQDVLDHRYRVPANVSLASWWITAKQKPKSTIIIDVLVSEDGGDTWETILDGSRIQLPGGSSGATGTNFEISSLDVGNVLRVDVVQASGGRVEVGLKGTYR